MARPDSGAQAAINQPVLRPAWFAFLDFVGDPVRATTWPFDVTLTGTGDAELEGQGFHSLDANAVSIGEVHNQEGGSETLRISLSGLILPDNELLNLVGDRANWHGRLVKLWHGQYNEANALQGNIWHFYTGWMSSLAIVGDPGQQLIQMEVENYLALISNASGRTYMDQRLFDPDDASGDLGAPIATQSPTPWGGGGGMGPGFGGGGFGGRVFDSYQLER